MVLEGLIQDEIKSVLESHKKVAVVGLSRSPAKHSHTVAKYLQSVGYRIIPVNPFVDQVLGETAYKSLLDIPETIDIVDIFRPSKDVPAILEQSITIKNKVGSPKVIWMQLGIVNEDAAKRAKEAGFTVVMDKCMRIEHKHLSRKGVLER